MKLPDPGALVALLAAAVFLAGLIRKAWPWIRKLVAVINDFAGEEARPGVERRPGLMERMATMEKAGAEKTRAIGDLTTEMSRLRSEQVAMSTDMAVLSSDMAEVKKELTYNGGSTVKDAVMSIRHQVNDALAQIPTQVIRVD